MPTLYLIDGSGYIFRAYHALPPLSSPSGTPVGAVYGFLNMLLKLRETTGDDAIAVVFDAGRHTFRNRMYDGYKANRPEAPADLIPQFALVREAADALGIARVERDDVEADDVIASYARKAREAGMEVVIVSSDKDLMQLVGEGIRMHDPIKNKPIGEAEVMEKFGVPPAKVREVLSLIGDSSDNVPGVPGIGPKTAAELIGQYGDLETLLAHAAEIRQEKRRAMLMEHADKARLSHALVGLKEDVELPLPLEALAARAPEAEKLGDFLQAQGFKSLFARLKPRFEFAEREGAPPVAASSPPAVAYEAVQEMNSLERWVRQAQAQGMVGVDLQATSGDAMRAEMIGVALSLSPGIACYIPLGHRKPGSESMSLPRDDLFAAPAGLAPDCGFSQLPRDTALAALKPLFEDASVLKVGSDIKYDALLLKRHGIGLAPVDDSMLLSYLLGAGLHGHAMEELSERYLGHKPMAYEEVTGTGKARIGFAEAGLEKACAYAAEDADLAFRLWRHVKPLVFAEHMLTLYETVERPLIPVLAAMEERGIRVDENVLAALSRDFAAKMAELEREIHALAGEAFNVGSPKQLGEVLFEKHGLPGRKSAKTGAWSTDNYVLEELAEQGYPLPVKVMEWRQLSKLKGTYTDALVGEINPQTRRVHTRYAMAATTTGRLSSLDPNLQNIPIRTAEGKKIRQAFVAEPGYALISADYSQIELRLLAHMAQIEPLRRAFRNGDDIHAITASEMFGVPLAEMNADLRRKAKTINFGIIYGISAHGLAIRLGLSRGEAATYIERYFQQYPGIRDYMEAKKGEARKHGYVTTLFGRRCHVPGIGERNAGRRQFAERQAINAPLQGTAADIIKKAMIAVAGALAPYGARAQMLLQVHDELVFEVAQGVEEEAASHIKHAMEHVAQFSVPLTVETGIGANWGAIH